MGKLIYCASCSIAGIMAYKYSMLVPINGTIPQREKFISSPTESRMGDDFPYFLNMSLGVVRDI